MQVKGEFEYDDPPLFFGCYRHLSAKSDVELRRLCAGQMPEVLRAASSLHAGAFSQQFSSTYYNLATDADPEVRTLIARQFTEVAHIVGRECPALLTRSLTSLLRDESPAVQIALLPNLPVALQQWSLGSGGDDAHREAAVADVASALLFLESQTARNWRMQQALAAAFPCFTQVFSSDQIHEHFVPIAWRYLNSTAAAVRPTAAEGLVAFFRSSRWVSGIV